jgi:lipid-A-disaccharide synthase-like uncharacterized protein
MIDSWRDFLYPLGFLASLLFAWRFMQQWIVSELRQKSLIPHSFWQLSFVANLLMMAHAFLQLQFHVCAIQACNAIISWRNLNLMQTPEQQVRRRTVIYLLIAAFPLVLLGFCLQGYFLGNGVMEWFRMPIWHGTSAQHVSLFWHLIGFVGLLLFSSRFWIQWWSAESARKSYVGLPFWWLSFIGGALSLLYFIEIEDPVNIIGPAFGMVPYVRNLMLLHKAEALEPSTGPS